MKPLDAPAELVAPAAITSAFGLMGVVLVELMGFVLVETMLALLLTLSDPPTQPAIAGAFVYLGSGAGAGRSVAKAEPDSAAAATIPPKIRFIEISSHLSAAQAA